MSRKILVLLAFLHFNLLIYAQSPETNGMPGPLMQGGMPAGLNDLGQQQPGGHIFGGNVNKEQQESHSMLGVPLQSWHISTPGGFPFPSHNPGLGRLPHGKITPSGQTPTEGTTTTFV